MKRPGRVRRGVSLLVVLLALAAVFSDFVSPNAPDVQDLEHTFAPPTRIRFVDVSGRFHWRPFVYRHELVDPLDVVYEEKTDAAYPLAFFERGYEYRLFGRIPSSLHLVLAGNGKLLPLGADELGRDVMARTLAGARTSLVVVLWGILAYMVVGLAIGSLAGLCGGWTDAVLMRFSEFVLALPALYVILALRATLPSRLSVWQALALTSGTIAAVTWPPLARGVRGLVLQLRSAGYVEAARALGAGEGWILRVHMLPALLPFVLAQSLLAAPVFLLGEVVLSFLDAGFSDSAASWGGMLRNLRDPRVLTDFWWNLAPLAFVFVALFGLNLLGGRGRHARQDRAAL